MSEKDRSTDPAGDHASDRIAEHEPPSPAELNTPAEDGFNWSSEPGQPARPGPEETPLARVERQIGHIKLVPDRYDFSIEDLGPWDTGVSEEWKRLPEPDKLSVLELDVDWRDVGGQAKEVVLARDRFQQDYPRGSQCGLR